VEIKVPNIVQGEIREKLLFAYGAATWSDDRSTKNGGCICEDGWVVCRGCNHFIKGYGHRPEHHERPLKYSLTEHAERDAIYNAARLGVKTEGLTLVANWVACADCARAIVCAGLGCVVTHKACMDRTPERWKEQVDLGLEIIRSHCDLVIWDGEIGGGVTNLNNGEIWSP